MGRRLATWSKQFSPFGFATLQGLPKVPWALPFVILFFCLIWRGYERNVDSARTLTGAISSFTYRIRVEKAAPPDVLILGGSTSGRSIVSGVLAEKLKRPVAKAAVSNGWIWEAHQVLKKYPEETKNVKLVCINFQSHRLGIPTHKRGFQNGNTFHALKDVTDLSVKNFSFIYNLLNREKKLRNKSPFFFPMKLSVRTIAGFSREPAIDQDERIWATYPRMTSKKLLASWQEVQARSKEPESHLKNYSDETEESVWDFVRYCQSRGIFVVFNIKPTWYKGDARKPEGTKFTEADYRFLALCMALEKTPNCAVLYLKNFRELAPNVDERELFYDQGHLTLTGATIYSQWLADQILSDPKITAALETPRKREEFVVMKYARALRLIAPITPIAVPTDLTATSKNANSLTIGWNTVANASGYKIQYAADAGFTQNMGVKAVEDGAANTTNIDDLTPGAQYFIRIRANGTGNHIDSAYSGAINVTSAGQLAPPKSLTATSKNATTLAVDWDVVPNASGYRIQYATDAGFTENARKLDLSDGATNTAHLIDLKPGMTYYIRIRTNGTGDYPTSAYSGRVMGTSIAQTAASSGNVQR